MRCEEFEERISAYLEGELDESSLGSFEEHLPHCQTCNDLVGGVQELRGGLRGLGASAPPPDFDLRLPSTLRHEMWQQRHAWAQPLTLGLAVAAALAILLWPVPQEDEEVAAHGQMRSLQSLARAWAPMPEPRVTQLWSATSGGRQTAPPYSHAQARTVSY